MKNLKRLKNGLALAFACLLFNSAAFAYTPAVHEALHAHENKSASKGRSDSSVFCSAQNHLAAELSTDDTPAFKVFALPEAVIYSFENRTAFFASLSASPRAPPALPA